MKGRRILSCHALLAGLLGAGIDCHARVPDVIAPIVAPFPMPSLTRPSFPDRTFDIRDYGAKPMKGANKAEQVIATNAIHHAIAAAHAVGGGKVIIPAGQWLTGPVHLKSHINLHLEKGARVFFSTNRNDYLPVVLQRHEGVEALNYSPLIYGYQLDNVAVTGAGVLDGQGEPWWTWFHEHGPPPRVLAARQPLSLRKFGKGADQEGMRPGFIVFLDSSKILVEGITLNNSPFWNIHLVYSRDAIVRNVRVNSLDAPNGDGIVVDSSRNVLLEYNHLETGDDAVVIKSGLNEDGLRINRPSENIVVRHFKAAQVRTGSGGIVFGSETSGGIRNVYVHDGYFEGADRGIRFKTERGRGNVIENIYIENIEMKRINQEAIIVDTFYTGPGATGPSPALRNLFIKDIRIDTADIGIGMTGLPEKWLVNIYLENISIKNTRVGGLFHRVKDLYLSNVAIQSGEPALLFDQVIEARLTGLQLKDAENSGCRFRCDLYQGFSAGANQCVDGIKSGDNQP